MNVTKTSDVNVFKIGEELTHLYFKLDVFLLTVIIKIIIKVSDKEYDNNPLFCVSLPRYIGGCGMKFTNFKLQTVQDKVMFPLLVNNIRGGISSALVDRHVKSDDSRKLFFLMLSNYKVGQ